MTKVRDLRPGDLVRNFGMEAVYVTHCPHPYYSAPMQLVLWKLSNGAWSHDALDLRQDVGEVAPAKVSERDKRLKDALFGPGSIR